MQFETTAEEHGSQENLQYSNSVHSRYVRGRRNLR
jgi:hypothetical protein